MLSFSPSFSQMGDIFLYFNWSRGCKLQITVFISISFFVVVEIISSFLLF